MFNNEIGRAGRGLADSLGDFIDRKFKKAQERDLLKSLLQSQQQGSNTTEDQSQQGSVSLSPRQSVNAADFLNQRPQNLIEQSLGKTPVSLQSLFKSMPSEQPATQKAQLPQVQQELQMPEEKQDRSWETPAIRARRELEELKGKNAVQSRIDKETLPYYEKIKKQAGTTAEIDARLDQMDELLDTGKVQSGSTVAFLDALKNLPWFVGKFGGVIEQMATSSETQVFKKLSQDFLRDAKPYFGSNLSTREVELFLERVPNLMQSNEGKRAVIRNFRALNEYTKDIDDIMEGIIAENGGERPRHMESKVQARSKKSAGKLRKSFQDSVKLIKKPKSSKDINAKESYKKKFFA